MNLAVTLCGDTEAWWFRDSARLDQWLRDLPWLFRGGLAVVRVASAEQASDTVMALRREIRAHDDGATDLAMRTISNDDLDRGLVAALAASVEISATRMSREFVEAFAAELRARTTVFLIEGTSAITTAEVDVISNFVERIAKSYKGACLTVIIVIPREAPPYQDSFDFTFGRPIGPLLQHLHDPDPSLWRRYVHARLAWEAAGQIAIAREYDSEVLSLVVGDDDGLERILNANATWRFQGLDSRIRQKYDALLSTHYFNISAAPAADVAVLVNAGGLWYPPGARQVRPAPWVARATLLRQPSQAAAYMLRATIICAPLLRELAGRLFDLEATERASCWAERQSCAPPVEAVERHRRFIARERRSEHRFYPPSTPAMPSDVWAFVTLGELFNVISNHRASVFDREELRLLRNMTAHGHFVGWTALTTLRRLETKLT